MKKTIILTSLLASVASIASGTTGTVEVYNSNKTEYLDSQTFNESFQKTESTFGVKTEVKVKDTGLSFGADIKAKDYPIFGSADVKHIQGIGNQVTNVSTVPLNAQLGSSLKAIALLAKIKENSSVWAKYDLPEMNNINSYVKAKYETKGKINVEADASYKLAEKLVLGLNSNTTFDFTGESAAPAPLKVMVMKSPVSSVSSTGLPAALSALMGASANVDPAATGTPILSDLSALTGIISAAGAAANVNPATTAAFANALASAVSSAKPAAPAPTGLTPDKVTSTHKVYLKGEYENVKDIYAELGVSHTYESTEAAKNVFLNAKASYMPTEVLTLTGKVDFKHTFNNGEMDDDSLLYGEHGKLKGKYRHSYLLGAKYTGIKDTELKLDAFIEHNLINDAQSKNSDPYSRLYFGFKPEVKYTGMPNLVLSSKNIFGGETEFKVTPEIKTKGYIKLNANAEYTYKVTDKFVVKPSLDLTAEFKGIGEEDALSPTLTITPKLAAEYKPIGNLTISGNIAPVVEFAENSDFGYHKTTVKSSINVKYTW